MDTEKVKIYFLGAGDIAVPVLAKLVGSEKIDIVGTGTQIDRPAGRKRKLTPTPVGQWAEANGLPIDKIANVNTDEFQRKLESLAPDIVLVISFGQIIRKELLELNNMVWVNVHASLLPAYRGASPITAAILNRDGRTGVAFMKMDEGLDTGPVFRIFEYALDGSEKADQLELDLGQLAADNAVEVMQDIADGNLVPVPQDDDVASLTRKIKKEYGIVDWNKSAAVIDAEARAYYPWPGSVFSLKGAGKDFTVRIIDVIVHDDLNGLPGEIIRANKKQWIIACGEGALELKRVVPQGKKPMGGADFLRGVQLAEGTVL